MKAIIVLICSFLFVLAFPELKAQTFNNRALSEGQAVKVLIFSKNASKRSMYYIGSTLKIKTVQGQKIKGTLTYMRDSMLIISGQQVLLHNIAAYYKPISTCLIVGTASGVAGLGYIALDAVNNGISGRTPITSAQTWIVGGSLLAAAAILLPFKEVQRKVPMWRPQILSIDPISY